MAYILCASWPAACCFKLIFKMLLDFSIGALAETVVLI